MVVEIPLTNLGLIAVSVSILLYALKRFHDSGKPYFNEPRNTIMRTETGHNELGEPIYSEGRQYTAVEFEKVKQKARFDYNIERTVYYATYFFPVTIFYYQLFLFLI